MADFSWMAMEKQEHDERFMRAAICEAALGEVEAAAPNPRVGAVIVEDGEIVGRGHFRRDGGAHAERWALACIGREPKAGASLYVTLEPCSTEGRTGACTRAIIDAGIKRVVVGMEDPTPEHRGRGSRVLQAAGVSVVTGVLSDRCAALNIGYRGHSTGG